MLKVFAADIDGDGDMDLASASYNDNKIAWYENTDGKGTFGSQQIVTTNAGGARSVFAADIDGDGDMDLASASYNDNKIAWYENTQGIGTFGRAFGSQQIVTTMQVVLQVYLLLILTEMEIQIWQVLLIMIIRLHGTKTQMVKEPLEVNRL